MTKRRKTKMKCALLGFWFLAVCAFKVQGWSVVVYPGKSRELSLLTAKIAAKRGLEAYYMCASGAKEGCQRLMYGNEYALDDGEEQGRAKPISTGEEIGESLQAARAIVLVCYDEAIEETTLDVLLSNAGNDLSKLVVLSKMGATQSTGSFLGGGNVKLFESENMVRAKAEERQLDLSVVRAGYLKGGGPGKDGNDFGLSKEYYNTLFDIVEAQVTMGHDKFTLGADCSIGDTVKMPNIFESIGTKSSFEPRQYDTSRTVAAGGVVAALIHEEPVEFSVSAAKAEQPPSDEEWEMMLQTL